MQPPGGGPQPLTSCCVLWGLTQKASLVLTYVTSCTGLPTVDLGRQARRSWQLLEPAPNQGVLLGRMGLLASHCWGLSGWSHHQQGFIAVVDKQGELWQASDWPCLKSLVSLLAEQARVCVPSLPSGLAAEA